MIVGIAGLVWLSGRYHWSSWQFLGVFILVGAPYGIFWWRLKDRVKLNQLRNGRRLARMNARG
jgi:hypothetical protein